MSVDDMAMDGPITIDRTLLIEAVKAEVEDAFAGTEAANLASVVAVWIADAVLSRVSRHPAPASTQTRTQAHERRAEP